MQGHTIKTINDEELLEEIKDPFLYEEVVHGTYYNCIDIIMKTGLNKMARNHIRRFRNILIINRYGSWHAWPKECHQWHEIKLRSCHRSKLGKSYD